MTTTQTRHAGPRWRVPAALLTLTAVPVVAGAVRMGQLTAGARITEETRDTSPTRCRSRRTSLA